MLDLLGLYASAFEGLFMEESELFYQTEGTEKLETVNTADYLEHCTVSLPTHFLLTLVIVS